MKTKSISRLFNLTGKAAVITGGAMGIGESIGLRLAEAGARVMIADVDLEKAEQTVEEIRAMEREAQAVYADVSRKDDVMELIRATLKAFGGLDILVNNAGISSQPFLPVMETQEENWDRVFEVNLKGMFLLSQAAGREMIKQGKGGRIINIASIAGIHHAPKMVSYSASKAGVISLTQSLALELAPHNILVNAIAPGMTMTPMAKAALGDSLPTENIALGRLAEPDEIACVALFLASEGATFMTGSTVVADGGRLLM